MQNELLKKLSMNLCSDKHNYMKSFRKNVDMYISEKDITLREVAEMADMPFDTLKNFLYKDSADCKLSTAVKLARAFNVSIDERYLDEKGMPDLNKLRPITYDPANHTYIALGEVVGKAFSDGNKLK